MKMYINSNNFSAKNFEIATMKKKLLEYFFPHEITFTTFFPSFTRNYFYTFEEINLILITHKDHMKYVSHI